MTIARLVLMRPQRLLTPLLAAAASLAVAAGCADGGTTVIADASLVVVNESDDAIYEIYLTGAADPDWGPNLLRGDVLRPDEELILGVNCDFYDALLVDEAGAECELLDLDLCLGDATWVIRNTTCDETEPDRARSRSVRAATGSTARP